MEAACFLKRWQDELHPQGTITQKQGHQLKFLKCLCVRVMSICWRASGTERKSDRNHVNFLCRCTAWRNRLLPYFKIPRRAEKWAESQIMCLPLLLFGMKTEEDTWQRLAAVATFLRSNCSLTSWHLLPVCAKSVSSALDPLQQEYDATEYKGLGELAEVFCWNTTDTLYWGRHLLIPACCASRGLPASVSMRPGAHPIFWHFLNSTQACRDSCCCMHCCCFVFSLPLRKGAKRDYQPWSCLSVRPSAWKNSAPAVKIYVIF